MRRFQPIILIILCAVLGWLLMTLPGRLIEQYDQAAALGAVWGYLYLGAVGLGAVLLIGSIGAVAWSLWRNTRANRKRKTRDRKTGRQMTEAEQRAAVTDHLEEAKQLADDVNESPELRDAIERDLNRVQTKLTERTLTIAAFGTISSGKSAVLNALLGQDVFTHDVKGGTTINTHEVPWPGADRVTLIDTPGLAEAQGGDHAQLARIAAKNADIVLFVIDSPIKDFEHRAILALNEIGKRLLICLNKQDWYAPPDLEALLHQVRSQVDGFVEDHDVVSVRAQSAIQRRVRIDSTGCEKEETIELSADIEALAKRLLRILKSEGKQLLLANLLLQSRGLVDEARQQVRLTLRRRAREIVDGYTWRAGGAAALSPVPVLDVAIGLGFSAKMVLDLAQVYRKSMDLDAARAAVEQLVKNLLGSLGAAAVTPVVSQAAASALKAVPGAGTIAGGVLQGLTQAIITQWIGRVMTDYFENEMTGRDRVALDELARQQWDQLTSTSELINLAATGLKRWGVKERDR